MEWETDQKSKVAFILLAAGDSRRFHGNKLLSNFRGKAMYRHIADQVEQLPKEFFCRKILVTQYPQIAEDLSRRGYEVVINPDSHLGISHSIFLALLLLEEADEDTSAACFAVCDQPWLKKETIVRLLASWNDSGHGLACLCHQGDFGNPAIFSRSYWAELKSLRGDIGGKRILRNHPDDLFLCEVEDGKELVDIDVPQMEE